VNRPKVPGNLLRTGHGTPTSAIGGDGDVYIDLDTGHRWQRVVNTWGQILDPAVDITTTTGTLPASRVSGVVTSPYRKTTVKQIVNSTAEADLLNSEITLAAGVLGTNKVAKLTAWGDSLFNGGSTATPRFKLKLGATTLIDTNSINASISNEANRWGWRLVAEIANTAANAQTVSFALDFTIGFGMNSGFRFTTGEGSLLMIPGSPTGGHLIGTGVNTAAVDTTVAQALQLTATLALASANIDIKLLGALVEIA
jgi:hypothetical protein